jgi:hypothetical protein
MDDNARPRPPDAREQRFAQLAWHFNCHIAAMAHPSWLRYPQQAADTAWSAHLLARSGVARVHDWRLQDTASRLWLLDAAALGELMHALRGVLQRPRLARTVRKTRRDELRAQWSEATWLAASDGSAPSLDASLFDLLDDERMPERAGARLLRGLVGPGRPAVAERARMRLPRGWRNDETAALPEAQRRALQGWIAQRWIPQRSAAWAWLF